MMKRWAKPPHAAGWLLVLAPPAATAASAASTVAGAPDHGGTTLLGIGAAVLAALCGMLGWRLVLLRERCATLRRQVVAEQALRASAERSLRDSHGTVSRMLAEQRGARDAERQRIGRDIHDDLGQHLLALQLDIGTLRGSAGLPDWARQQVGMIEQHVQLTIRALRAVIHDLRPAALEQGLRLAVQRQLDEFSRVSGIRCHFETLAPPPADAAPAARSPAHRSAFAAAETALFRMLQETLSNVLRHAGASEVHVALGCGADALLLVVRDNGIGLPPGSECRGHGLSGIAARVAAAGGELALDSAPGQGTAVRIALPASLSSTAESDEPEYCA